MDAVPTSTLSFEKEGGVERESGAKKERGASPLPPSLSPPGCLHHREARSSLISSGRWWIVPRSLSGADGPLTCASLSRRLRFRDLVSSDRRNTETKVKEAMSGYCPTEIRTRRLSTPSSARPGHLPREHVQMFTPFSVQYLC